MLTFFKKRIKQFTHNSKNELENQGPSSIPIEKNTKEEKAKRNRPRSLPAGTNIKLNNDIRKLSTSFFNKNKKDKRIILGTMDELDDSSSIDSSLNSCSDSTDEEISGSSIRTPRRENTPKGTSVSLN